MNIRKYRLNMITKLINAGVPIVGELVGRGKAGLVVKIAHVRRWLLRVKRLFK